MIKIIGAFLILFVIFFFGIKSFRDMNKKEKWDLTKLSFYSIICAIVSLVFMIVLVLLF